MSNDKLVYDARGGYTSMSEMDVKNGTKTSSKSESGSTKSSATQKKKDTTTKTPNNRKAPLSLNKLKTSAGMTKKTVEKLVGERKEEPATPSAKSSKEPAKETETPKTITEPVKEAVVTEPVKEPVKEAVVTEPTKEAVVTEPTKEAEKEEVVTEPVKEPVKESVVTEPVKEPVKELELNQVSDKPIKGEETTEPVKEEVVTEPVTEPVKELEIKQAPKESVKEDKTTESVNEEVQSTPVQDVKKMDLSKLTGTHSNNPKKEEPSSLPELELNKVSESAPIPQRTSDNSAYFVLKSLSDFLELTKLNKETLSEFAGLVINSARRGAIIWQSSKHELLRAYCCRVGSGGNKNYLLCIGWDIYITACYVGTALEIADASYKLKCVGTCAFIDDVPVALSSERNRPAKLL